MLALLALTACKTSCAPFQSNNALLERYVWSPANGQMILRDAVAANLSSYTGLSTVQANTSGGIRRLYPLTDGQGSIVAVTDPTGTVQERYTYDVNGLPQSLNADFTARSASSTVEYASTLGWNWFYHGQQWVQTQPDAPSLIGGTQWRGLYVTASGTWYDPVHGTTLQPSQYGTSNPMRDPYALSTLEQVGTYAPVIVAVGATLASSGLRAPLLVGAGLAGAASVGVGSYVAGNSRPGGCPGRGVRRPGRSGRRRHRRTCGHRRAGPGGRGWTDVRQRSRDGWRVRDRRNRGRGIRGDGGLRPPGLITGSLADAAMASWQGGLMGGLIGGPLGAIFHEVCFVAGTVVHTAAGTRTIETLTVGRRALTEETKDGAALPGDDPTQVDSAMWRLALKQANAKGVLGRFLAAGSVDTPSGRRHEGRGQVSDCVVFHAGLGLHSVRFGVEADRSIRTPASRVCSQQRSGWRS